MQTQTTRRHPLERLLGVVAVVGLVACHGGDGRTNEPTGPIPGASTPHAAVALTAAVVVVGTLPVELRFGVPVAPVQGSPASLSLQLSGTNPQPALRLQIRGEDGLEIQEPSELTVERLDPGAPKGLELTVKGTTPGLHLVSVDVGLDLNGGGSRSFQFPVLVAPR